jgi:hypothetical protein
MGYRLDGGARDILFSREFIKTLGPNQLPNEWAPGPLSSEVKQPGCEADYSPPSITSTLS